MSISPFCLSVSSFMVMRLILFTAAPAPTSHFSLQNIGRNGGQNPFFRFFYEHGTWGGWRPWAKSIKWTHIWQILLLWCTKLLTNLRWINNGSLLGERPMSSIMLEGRKRGEHGCACIEKVNHSLMLATSLVMLASRKCIKYGHACTVEMLQA